MVTLQVGIDKFKTRKVKTKVIDTKESTTGAFKINLSQIQSQTLIPAFQADPTTKLLYVDVGGFHDNVGPLAEILNSLIIKSIFNRAGSIRFLITLTQSQIKDHKGIEGRKHISLIRQIVRDNLDTIIDCIQPVITKSKPGDKNTDLTYLRKLVTDQLQKEVLQEEQRAIQQFSNFESEFENQEDMQERLKE